MGGVFESSEPPRGEETRSETESRTSTKRTETRALSVEEVRPGSDDRHVRDVSRAVCVSSTSRVGRVSLVVHVCVLCGVEPLGCDGGVRVNPCVPDEGWRGRLSPRKHTTADRPDRRRADPRKDEVVSVG